MTSRSPPTKHKNLEYQEFANSIDRSRKRHLEVGLLRGDQVHDRLKEQEASASPFLKRPRATSVISPPTDHTSKSNMAMTMAEFRDYMENNTNKRFDGLDEKMSSMQTTVRRMDTTVKENSDAIRKNEAKIMDICAEVEKIKDGKHTAPADPFPSLRPPDVNREQERDYHAARRSLRLWPVEGTTRDELWKAAGIFLGTNLGMEGKLNENSIDSISRVEIPSGPGVRQEVLVRFKNEATRDLVMGAAAKLAPYMDADGRATAGIRMEVPAHLQQNFRVLFKYGQNLRARHGQGTRRHVKFCDIGKTLFLNIKLPGDDVWSKVSMEVAMRGMRARETMDDGQLERRLDITGPLNNGPRPRAASTAGPPPPTQASAWTRRSGGSSSS